MSKATNITFTIRLKVIDRIREFNFRKRTDSLFDVDTNNGNIRCLFQMNRDEHNAWQLRGGELPDWLLNIGPLIASEFEKELTKN